jgi:tetratricopeptide (TPR) repeat protein
MYQQGLEIFKRTIGEETTSVANVYNNIGEVLGM